MPNTLREAYKLALTLTWNTLKFKAQAEGVRRFLTRMSWATVLLLLIVGGPLVVKTFILLMPVYGVVRVMQWRKVRKAAPKTKKRVRRITITFA